MFQDKQISRNEFEGMIEALGYTPSDRLKSFSDDELRKSVLSDLE